MILLPLLPTVRPFLQKLAAPRALLRASLRPKLHKICRPVGADTRLGRADEPPGPVAGAAAPSVLQFFRIATANSPRRVLSLNILLTAMQGSNRISGSSRASQVKSRGVESLPVASCRAVPSRAACAWRGSERASLPGCKFECNASPVERWNHGL